MKHKYKKIVIGIDQSYERTGIGIACDGKLMKVKGVPLGALRNPSEKRKHIRSIVTLIIEQNLDKAAEIIIYCERIRTFSKGFISTDYIKATGALIATIVDVAEEYGIPTRSVDTRSWKSNIVGTSKGVSVTVSCKPTSKNPSGKKQVVDNKLPTIRFINKLGFYPMKSDDEPDDDACDAGCIALYGFLPEKQQKYKVER